MLKLRFREEWMPHHSDWDKSFDPFKYVWVIEDGRFHAHNNDEFVDIAAVDAPHGEWMRLSRNLINLTDVINLYEDGHCKPSDAYGWVDGRYVFLEDGKKNSLS